MIRDARAEAPTVERVVGQDAVRLATQLTMATYALVGRPHVALPRAEWPATLIRPVRS